MSATEKTNSQTCTVEEAAKILGIGRRAAYQGVNDGSIPSVRIGRRVLIPLGRLHALLNGEAAESSKNENAEKQAEQAAFDMARKALSKAKAALVKAEKELSGNHSDLDYGPTSDAAKALTAAVIRSRQTMRRVSLVEDAPGSSEYVAACAEDSLAWSEVRRLISELTK